MCCTCASQYNNRVKYLCLSHNEFGEKAGLRLAPAIGKL